MIAVVQRVASADVKVDGREVARIGKGLLVLAGVQKGDDQEDTDYMVRKLAGLRIFNDAQGKMNLALDDPAIQGEILAVSQFTLSGDVRKGRRPSFVSAEEPGPAEKKFDELVEALRARSIPVRTGIFGAMMEVSLVNDGPVTLIIDSRAGRMP
jgi:D-tyrosyl-tRNA(Tyr) deacylase